MAKKSKKETADTIIEEVKEQLAETQDSVVTEEEPQTPEELLQSEVAVLNDKYLRLYSDFENFRKRTAKERIELSKTASASVMEALLPVMDDFDRALANMENAKDVDSVKQGVDLIYEKLTRELSNKGLKKFVPTGEVFDSELHEAITQIPAPEDDMRGKVVDTIENGYQLFDKVIRYAKVVVGS